MSTHNESSISKIGKPSVSTGLDYQPELHEEFAAKTRWGRRRYAQYLWQNLKFALPLILTDLIVLMCCHAAIAGALELIVSQSNAAQIVQNSVVPISLTILFGFFLRLYPAIGLQPVIELRQSVLAIFLSYFSTIYLMSAYMQPQWIDFVPVVFPALMAMVLMPSARQFVRQYLGTTDWWPIPVFLFAGGPSSEMVWRSLRIQSSLGWRPVGIIEDFFSEWDKSPDLDHHYVGVESDVRPLAFRNQVFWGIIDGVNCSGNKIAQMVDRHSATLPKMVALQELQGCPSLFSSSAEVGGQPGIAFENRLNQLFPRMLKRTFDIVVAGGALLALSPFLLTFALIIKLTSPGPILYSQARYGYLGKKFRIWKFRTMIQNADKVLEEYFQKNPSLREEYEIHHKLANDPRITWIGKFLRKASIDEIPQLWNVLIGEMSIVGPRPILLDELEKYGDVFPLYCRVIPGITGLWQVNGRNQAAYEARLIYATYYIRNWSIWMDCYILLKTVRVVLFCEGAC